ncbi:MULTISPECIES: CopC domain-containing protein YobA [Enterobacter]|uniref:CopC domain-containing protein YobA n=1 Tax=Enterobacter TaxID=547 RepID=UPI0010A63DEA|nr:MULTISPECIES: CopC domain-containing protein YobA [Enterobacter]MBE3207564.1 CopC domain-containing protein YobA [Enterobacter cloacae complex sp. P32C]MBY6298807.1 CopC domain-containing protein YobA [Enterobacter bugandensis]MCM7429308.1 CopC domain-containing protein YobA [Enterobacter bugandensis]MEA5165035.1 CopC domain-containing protein YobA [Enterobacter bugandensis]QCE25662.1 CopC domain-containing protein YobA [Enterobacter bugandensis]
MGLSASRAVCALVFLASTVISPSVLAHAHLEQQSPAADSQVASPQVLTLNFSEGVEPGFSGVVVTDAQKQVIKTGTATRDEKNKAQLTVPLKQTLAPGAYQVDWHVVSVDGHKTKGSYRFSVK